MKGKRLTNGAFAFALAPAATLAIAGAASGVPTVCYWENGLSAQNPQGIPYGFASDIDTVDFGVERRTCDDFVVGDCECLELDQIFAEFLTNSDPTLYLSGTWEAVLTIYDTDCWGCPGNALITSYSSSSTLLSQPAEFQGFSKIRYQFDDFVVLNSYNDPGFGAACEPDPPQDLVWLCEGRYWLSVQHVGDGTWLDDGFWCGTDKFQGAEAVHYSNDAAWSVPACTKVSTLNQNFGKRDFVFRVCGRDERVICDNLAYALDVPSEGFSSPLNIATPNNFAADNFQIRCTPAENWQISYIELKLAASFIPCEALVEVWTGDCYPESLVSSLSSSLVVSTGEQTTGTILDVYCAQFCNFNLPLLSGQNYWLVASVHSSGFLKTVFWLNHYECERQDYCIKISQGRFYEHVRDEWIEVGDPTNGVFGEHRDFAFKICGDRNATGAGDPTPAPAPADDECAALRKIVQRMSVFGGSGAGIR